MSYTITVRVFQTNPTNGPHRCVERTVWNFANGGTWDETKDTYVLTMGGSGTSGILRFKNDKTGDDMTFAFGVHNYKCWGDIVTGLSNGDTATVVQRQYYEGSTPGRFAAREAQRREYKVASAKGTNCQYQYTVPEGQNLEANLILG